MKYGFLKSWFSHTVCMYVLYYGGQPYPPQYKMYGKSEYVPLRFDILKWVLNRKVTSFFLQNISCWFRIITKMIALIVTRPPFKCIMWL